MDGCKSTILRSEQRTTVEKCNKRNKERRMKNVYWLFYKKAGFFRSFADYCYIILSFFYTKLISTDCMFSEKWEIVNYYLWKKAVNAPDTSVTHWSFVPAVWLQHKKTLGTMVCRHGGLLEVVRIRTVHQGWVSMDRYWWLQKRNETQVSCHVDALRATCVCQ